MKWTKATKDNLPKNTGNIFWRAIDSSNGGMTYSKTKGFIDAYGQTYSYNDGIEWLHETSPSSPTAEASERVEAIAFGNWIIKKKYDHNYNNGKWSMNEPFNFDTKDYYTTEQLYQIYIKQNPPASPLPSSKDAQLFDLSYEDVMITIQEMEWQENIPTKEFIEQLVKLKK